MNPLEFEIPTHFTVDGEWFKGAIRTEMSRMHSADLLKTNELQKQIVRESGKMGIHLMKKMGMCVRTSSVYPMSSGYTMNIFE